MTDKEVMQMALDWFHWFQHGTNPNGAHVLEVEEALRAALAQPEPEPVAWRIRSTDPLRDWTLMYCYPRTEEKFSNMEIQPLYTKPHSAAHLADSAEPFCKPELMSCSVRFPRHTPKHGEDWIIDPAFLLRVYHSIDPDANYGFIPIMEEIETALLALEVIPSNLYTAPPQQQAPVIDKTMATRIATQLGWVPKREWVGLTPDEHNELTLRSNALLDHIYEYGTTSEGVLPILKSLFTEVEAKLKEKNNG